MHKRNKTKSPRLSSSQEKTLDMIVAQMESCDSDWQMPWHCSKSIGSPVNVYSGLQYRGFNRLVLMMKQNSEGYNCHTWGTMRQWNSRRSKIIAGHKATTLFYPVMRRNTVGEEQVAYFRPFWVFNGKQVTNYNPEHPDLFEETKQTSLLPEIAHLLASHDIDLRNGGNSAFYSRHGDFVSLPHHTDFVGSNTSSSEESYYATLLHELVHWTGHKQRLNRPAHEDFGDEVYAFEELVAELGAAFLCCDYKVTNQPRVDHAQYLKSWLLALENDKTLLWQAAGKAQLASDYLLNIIEVEPEHDWEKPTEFTLNSTPLQPELF